MAEIDHAGFAHAVADRLAAKRLSYGLAVAKWPETNKALWSRVHAGKPLSAGNFLLVCRLLRLSPWRFWHPAKARRVTMKTIVKQAVTVGVSRETGSHVSRAKGAPTGVRRTRETRGSPSPPGVRPDARPSAGESP